MDTDLTIGAVSERTGVAPSALRFYEAEGLIHADRTEGDQRRYPRDVLRRVSFIRVAQQVGLSLDEIRAALASLPENRTPTAKDWERLSTSWRPRLDAQIAHARAAPRPPRRLHRLRLPLARSSASCSTPTTRPPSAGRDPATSSTTSSEWSHAGSRAEGFADGPALTASGASRLQT